MFVSNFVTENQVCDNGRQRSPDRGLLQTRKVCDSFVM
uniref:Uncharacterized protein n=1 Tax=Siphoviridae sp. ctEIp38 TaxID=2825394 RepID=A0A8S5QEW2_9CAUD|nr:MAG TPA: hypothetical protein [Siphoviridae sp. ctEIp38]